MFTMDETTIRWGDAARTSYAVRVKQEADPDYFDCAIIRDDCGRSARAWGEFPRCRS